MAPRKWPESVKARALALFAEGGSAVASEVTGVPRATIKSWARRESLTVATVAASSGVELLPVSVPWAQRRVEVAQRAGDLTVMAAEQLGIALAEGRARDARDLSVTLGVLVDKSLLLNGEATHRSESLSVSMSAEETERRIRELREELGHA